MTASRFPRLCALTLSVALLLGGCTESGTSPPPPDPVAKPFEAAGEGVSVTAAPGAVPEGTTVEIARRDRPVPLARLEVAGLTQLGDAVDITLDGGATQPASPLRVAIDVPRRRARQLNLAGRDTVTGVVVSSTDPDHPRLEYIAGRYDKGTGQVIAQVPHLSWVWPVHLDVGRVVDEAFTYVLEATGIETARPDCVDEEPTVGEWTYSVIQPAQAWVCLEEVDETLRMLVQPNSPVPFLFRSDPAPDTVTPLTDLSDESTASAAFVRGMRWAAASDGMIGPGISTRFTYDDPAVTSVQFRAEASLLMVHVLVATMAPILDAKGIETLGKASCMHDVVETASSKTWNASTAASLTTAFFSCVPEAVSLTPAGAVLVALLSAGPQAFAGMMIGLVGEFTGINKFSLTIDRQQARVPPQFAGRWFVHGAQLRIRADGRAVSEGWNASCPQGEFTSFDDLQMCTDVLRMVATLDGEVLRLEVTENYRQFEDGTVEPRGKGYAQPGSYYLMRLLEDGLATTELHQNGKVTRDANGLGNPYLCRPGTQAAESGRCGA